MSSENLISLLRERAALPDSVELNYRRDGDGTGLAWWDRRRSELQAQGYSFDYETSDGCEWFSLDGIGEELRAALAEYDANAAAESSPRGQGDAVLRAINSKDLYQVLMDVQNGIDSPALASMANGAIQLIDKARSAVAALSAQPSPATCKEGLQVQPSPGGQGDALAMVRSNLRSIADLASKAGRDPVAIANINCEVTHALQLLDLAARQPVGEPVCSGGFVIANGSGEKYMAWGQVGPEWTADRSAALWLVRRADAEALAAENEDAWSILPVERCALPPNGWACTLAAGHEGPCPTIAAPPAQAVEMSPEFTDTARAAIAWVLWHHQGGSSPVGQPLRFALGMGQHDRMTDQQIAEAKRFAAWANATTEDFHQRAPAQDVELAPDHRGMRVDYHGLLGRSQEALRQRPELAEMVRQLHGHLTELGRRWYAGDRSVVDEFLQLYVIEADGRRELISSGSVCHSRPTWSVLQIGNEGAFYDPKGARRAFTYEKQPGNVIAGILGNATFGEYSGDSIDRGLALLKYLQEQGFGVFQTGEKVGQ